MICPYCKTDHNPNDMCEAKEKAYFPGKFKTADTLKRKPNQSGTNYLQGRIVMFVKEQGGVLYRVNVGGIYREGKEEYNETVGRKVRQKGNWIQSGSTKGVPDLVGMTSGGRFLAVEVKYGKDTMKPIQEKRRNEILSTGGIHIIAKTYEQFKAEWGKKA